MQRQIFAAAFVLAVFSAAGILSAGDNDFSNADSPNAFEIEAWAFDRGNVAVFLEEYRNGGPPIIANGGTFPNEVEYDIPFPTVGQYELKLLLAMLEVRPLRVSLDGKELGTVCNGTATGSWNSVDAVWDAPLSFSVPTVGKHTLKLTAASGAFPHVARLQLVSAAPLPQHWILERPQARKIIDPYRDFENAAKVNPEAMRRAIVDLSETYHEKYPNGKRYLERLDSLLIAAQTVAEQVENKSLAPEAGAKALEKIDRALEELQREALLSDNPAVDFDEILLVRRHLKGPAMGMPMNWESNSSLPKGGYDDEILSLSLRDPQGKPAPDGSLRPVYKPNRDTLISDVDLNFDAGRLLFSAVGENDHWHVFEHDLKSKETKQLTHGDGDVDFYDSCYLPDGRVVLTCTAPMVGVPCVFGSSHVANLFLLEPSSGSMRQLCFDQEHNWCPTVLPNGRVLYTRWEYADTPHANTRLLFHCNPDGTEQLEYYGSNSYWPTSIFQARPLPGTSSKVVGVVGGHHDSPRMGELVILDTAKGRYETDGAVQRIPGFGQKVERIVADGLTRASWPKFLHPYPIGEKEFLVAAKPTPASLFGIYLVDVFDNMILLKEMPDNALLEPIPLKTAARPPIIPDKVDLSRTDATVYISDIYSGRGLQGIPRGEVKALRVFTYHFGYQEMGGLLGSIGQDGPWDIRSVLGTVPVEEDGSALFSVPANLPFAVQPLDRNGQAMQLMRSWMTAMPGEILQCSGCHETQNTVPPISSRTLALQKEPLEIQPYYVGDTLIDPQSRKVDVRGFAFAREVQPVLDRYCIECHSGEAEKNVKTAIVQDRPVGTALDGKPFAIDLRGDRLIASWSSDISGNVGYIPNIGGQFSVGYDNLQRFVRRPGIESDYEMFVPYEYAANTTELVQILKNGHYGVQLDADSWNRLISWIDMNTPYHGSWSEIMGKPRVDHIAKRRLDLLDLYGGAVVDFESRGQKTEDRGQAIEFVAFSQPASSSSLPTSHSPLPTSSHPLPTKIIDLGNGQTLELVRIPAEKPFWLGTCELTNGQYRAFDPAHDSRHESRMGYQFGRRGYDVNGDELPVVRVNWNEAKAFCDWLGKKTGLAVNLPTEEQWEFACRAGTTTPFWFGDLETNFAKFANCGDRRLKEFVACTAHDNYTAVRVIPDPNPFDDRFPKDERFDDGAFLQTAPGQYAPNPFGLYDMHGNVSEWTRSETNGEKVVRGGSWYDRPYRCTSDYRIAYPAYQPVFNVGFRIAIEE